MTRRQALMLAVGHPPQPRPTAAYDAAFQSLQVVIGQVPYHGRNPHRPLTVQEGIALVEGLIGMINATHQEIPR